MPPPPVRFFCTRCNLMIKIGAQMAGQSVVCPQCAAKIQVPQQSDPQAEALHKFLKQKRAREKSGSSSSSPEQNPVPAPPAAPNEKQDDIVDTLDELEDLKPDEIDDWIDEFWATVPETERHDSGILNPPHVFKQTLSGTSAEDLENANEVSCDVARYRQTVFLFRVWLLVVFFIGLVAGIYSHSVYLHVRQRLGRDAANISSACGEQAATVCGNLYRKDFDGSPTPDADAVVMVLPQQSPPKYPISVTGLTPNDDLFDPHGDGVQQIVEIGGGYQHTGAGGEFLLPIKSAGRYWVLMISSHAKRNADEPIDPATTRALQKYCRHVEQLIGEYRFTLNEYDFEHGNYVLKEIF